MLNKHEFWSITNRFFSLFVNSIILFLIAKFLNSQDVALWYLFLAIFGIVGIIEGGFMQTISRHITYIQNGSTVHSELDINEFIKVNNEIFIKLVAIIAILTSLFGTGYLINLDKFILANPEYISWFLFLIGSVTALFANLYGSIAVGFQKVANVQKNQIYALALNFLVVLFFFIVLTQINLLSIIIGYSSSQFLLLYLNYILASTFFRKSNKTVNSIFIKKIVFKDMKKMFLNMLSYKLLTSIYFIILSGFLSVNDLASYGLTFQILTYISGFSMILLSSNFPYFASLYSSGKFTKLKKIFILKTIVSFSAYMAVISIFLIFSKVFLNFLELKTTLLENELLLSFLFFISIEYMISLIGIFLLVCNELRLMVISFFSTIFILTTTYVLFWNGIDTYYLFIARGLIDIVLILIPAIFLLKKINSRMIIQ